MWLWPAAWLLLAPAAQAQGSACEQVKAMLAARIEATGVRGYSLDIVPAADKVPAGAQSIGTCAGGANKIVYRRFAAAPPTPAEPASAPPAMAAPAAAPQARLPPPKQPPVEAPAPRPAPLAAAPSPAPLPVPAPPVAAVAPTVPSAEDRMRAIDEAIAQMAQAPTLELPAAMTLGDTAKIRLSLGRAGPEPGAGAPLAVAERIEVRLSGDNFRIAALTPEDQPATAAGRSVWQWEAQPTSTGAHSLRLAMSAVFRVDGAPLQRAVRTFDKTVEIRTPLTRRAAAFATAHWPWLLALLLVPAAAWVWRSRHSAYDEAGLPRGPRL